VIAQGLLAHIDDGATRDALAAAVADPAVAALVAGVLCHSPFLTRLIRRHPEWLRASLDTDADARFAALVGEVLPSVQAEPLPDAMATLRRLRQQVALHVALADLGGVWVVDRVVAALTEFADAAVDAALRLALVEADRLGRISLPAAFARPDVAGITILAMGKHGAHELNYSSDIDLIALFDPARLPVVGHREPLDEAVRIIKDLVRVLHEQTGGGYVFRTDLRLRPDPGSTPIVVPIERAIHYYQTVGQNWERAALIKARPVAGDRALGREFLSTLAPFVWRKYFDYAAIADIHAMKRQIYAHKGGEAIAIEGHDVKLGRGGIREIEFFVQTQQLVFGGKRPALRGATTLGQLEALAAESWISAQARDDLSVAYRHLRMIEHRLQMLEDQQTQRLPTRKDGLDAFALWCGETPAAFRRGLAGELRKVERHYARLFEDAPALGSGIGNLVFTGTTDDPETLDTLRRLGFQRPEMVAETVRGWHFGRRPAMVSARAREGLTELTPVLLEAFGRASDPDGAILALDQALASMPAVVELFTILRQNGAMRQLFAEILGTAPKLAETVVQRPHVLDALIDPEFARPADQSALRTRFRARLGAIDSLEEFLDSARDLARIERFLVGARLMSGVMPPADTGPAYAAIADVVLEMAFARAEAETALRHGRVPGAAAVVVALGKHGGREMTARSDLDLIVIYDVPDAAAESDGVKPIMVSEWYARATQRLVSILTAPTRRGILYDVDLRLRPSGGKGPVAVALAAFRAYHAGEAEIWEHMALTRARVVAGDPGLAEAVAAAVRDVLRRPRTPASVLPAIRDMRALVAREKPAASRFDLKLAPGGFVDIEFAAQASQLVHAAAAPQVLDANTGRAIAALEAAGRLGRAQAEALSAAWTLQSALAPLLALGRDLPFDPAGARPPFLKKLAAMAALPDFRILDRALADVQAGAHAVMRSVLSPGEG
jgi:glutamate-ammonia-ligase adenylyltransferase